MQIEPRVRHLVLLVAVLLAGALIPAAAGVNRWTPFGPGNGPILAFAVSPGEPGTLYASHEFGCVFKSTDAGVSWRAAGQGLDGETVSDLAPAGSALYAVTVSGKVFTHSLDGGTWQRVHSGE